MQKYFSESMFLFLLHLNSYLADFVNRFFTHDLSNYAPFCDFLDCKGVETTKKKISNQVNNWMHFHYFQ